MRCKRKTEKDLMKMKFPKHLHSVAKKAGLKSAIEAMESTMTKGQQAFGQMNLNYGASVDEQILELDEAFTGNNLPSFYKSLFESPSDFSSQDEDEEREQSPLHFRRPDTQEDRQQMVPKGSLPHEIMIDNHHDSVSHDSFGMAHMDTRRQFENSSRGEIASSIDRDGFQSNYGLSTTQTSSVGQGSRRPLSSHPYTYMDPKTNKPASEQGHPPRHGLDRIMIPQSNEKRSPTDSTIFNHVGAGPNRKGNIFETLLEGVDRERPTFLEDELPSFDEGAPVCVSKKQHHPKAKNRIAPMLVKHTHRIPAVYAADQNDLARTERRMVSTGFSSPRNQSADTYDMDNPRYNEPAATYNQAATRPYVPIQSGRTSPRGFLITANHSDVVSEITVSGFEKNMKQSFAPEARNPYNEPSMEEKRLSPVEALNLIDSGLQGHKQKIAESKRQQLESAVAAGSAAANARQSENQQSHQILTGNAGLEGSRRIDEIDRFPPSSPGGVQKFGFADSVPRDGCKAPFQNWQQQGSFHENDSKRANGEPQKFASSKRISQSSLKAIGRQEQESYNHDSQPRNTNSTVSIDRPDDELLVEHGQRGYTPETGNANPIANELGSRYTANVDSGIKRGDEDIAEKSSGSPLIFLGTVDRVATTHDRSRAHAVEPDINHTRDSKSASQDYSVSLSSSESTSFSASEDSVSLSDCESSSSSESDRSGEIGMIRSEIYDTNNQNSFERSQCTPQTDRYRMDESSHMHSGSMEPSVTRDGEEWTSRFESKVENVERPRRYDGRDEREEELRVNSKGNRFSNHGNDVQSSGYCNREEYEESKAEFLDGQPGHQINNLRLGPSLDSGNEHIKNKKGARENEFNHLFTEKQYDGNCDVVSPSHEFNKRKKAEMLGDEFLGLNASANLSFDLIEDVEDDLNESAQPSRRSLDVRNMKGKNFEDEGYSEHTSVSKLMLAATKFRKKKKKGLDSLATEQRPVNALEPPFVVEDVASLGGSEGDIQTFLSAEEIMSVREERKIAETRDRNTTGNTLINEYEPDVGPDMDAENGEEISRADNNDFEIEAEDESGTDSDADYSNGDEARIENSHLAEGSVSLYTIKTFARYCRSLAYKKNKDELRQNAESQEDESASSEFSNDESYYEDDESECDRSDCREEQEDGVKEVTELDSKPDKVDFSYVEGITTPHMTTISELDIPENIPEISTVVTAMDPPSLAHALTSYTMDTPLASTPTMTTMSTFDHSRSYLNDPSRLDRTGKEAAKELETYSQAGDDDSTGFNGSVDGESISLHRHPVNEIEISKPQRRSFFVVKLIKVVWCILAMLFSWVIYLAKGKFLRKKKLPKTLLAYPPMPLERKSKNRKMITRQVTLQDRSKAASLRPNLKRRNKEVGTCESLFVPGMHEESEGGRERPIWRVNSSLSVSHSEK